MFSIAAINDTDSKSQWEPLAPTKEAQEFHLSQTYHEGLLKLQAKEYVKARELLESVLKDPIIDNAPVDGCASDEHLLQLRFLALKNLANVFLQQGPEHYESALRCYLQAVEIDSKDSVVWNQLGTLSCSMGLLSISRWAFEQGLLCSPNNWNCMEKLLEVLIAIGDEVACLSVAELILRHWPSHSRALHVKITIEESKPVPFSPRGIDKLQPKHVRLKFPDKRKANNEELDEGISLKKPNQNIEVILAETSWVALADALLDILLPLTVGNSEQEHKSGDVRLIMRLPISLENVMDPFQGKESNNKLVNFSHCSDERKIIVKEKEANALEEQHHERRSSRLERLRSRKPGKEESEFTCAKDRAKVVNQCLAHFVGSTMSWRYADATTCSSNLLDIECGDVSRFVLKNSKNYGAYHMAHMLLEEIARRGVNHRDNSVKFLELEKLTRFWGKDRATECSLFLAELYHDFALCASSMSKKSEFMSEASYHLCKIIESIALTYPFDFSCAMANRNCLTVQRHQEMNGETTCKQLNDVSSLENLLLVSDYDFWIQFFWLSGRLSVFDGNKAKAEEEFAISLSLMEKKQKMDDGASVISLPHCKAVKKLSIDRIMYEINVLKLDILMEKTIDQLIEKEMYMDCVILLAPLLFSAKDVYIDALSFSTQDGMITSTELLALDILIEACQKSNPMNIENYLSAHRRKLQILVVAAQLDEDLVSCKSSYQMQVVNPLTCSDTEFKETPSKSSVHMLAEEVRELSQCVSQVKSFMSHSKDSSQNGITVPESIISEIQSMLLSVMSNVASILCQKSSELVISDQSESCCFVDAAIVFCKFQHLDGAIPIKTQVDLIIAMHDLLAEYGLCCAGQGAEGEEGTFLRFAIKHLLALDMKFKTNFYCLNRELIQSEEQISQDSLIKASLSKSVLDNMDDHVDQSKTEKFNSPLQDDSEGLPSKEISLPKDRLVVSGTASIKSCNTECDDIKKDENVTDHLVEDRNGLDDDEREELESKIDSALDQCFFCLYGLNLRSDSSYEEDLAMHKNTSRGDYQTKEQCADVFRYILPYAKASSRTGLVKLRRVLRAIRKHFPQPPEDLLGGNPIDKFLDDPNLCENGLSEEAGSNGFLETITDIMFPNVGGLMQYKTSSLASSEPYLEVYSNLYYFLALSEEMSATDKWTGFVLTKDGEEFVQQNANLFKYDLLYNPFRFQSWQKLANIYDEEVDLLLNDGSKHINVVAWRKNATLPQRVETSRRRSRRCLLMGLALAKTSAEQCEIHELLALVYYDSIQNVVPFYDQRAVVPSKDAAWMLFCENSMKHFRKAFSHKIDWLYAFYLGKLSQKLGYSHDIALSYYDKAISLNTSAVDAFYRMHASRLKLLYTCGEQNLEVLKVVSAYSFNPNAKEAVMNILGEMAVSPLQAKETINQDGPEVKRQGPFHKLEEAWSILYSDCLSALETCVEGDLKHYHKARYMLAQGLYRRGKKGDLERAKEELSFCFKSSRSSFTINMWEIDSMVKKGRRKTPGAAGSKRALEVNLPESSRKFITCIRKYVLFYLKLLEETKDTCTFDRAYISLRADKRFSLCIEDLVPVALGRYLKALVSSVHQSLSASSETPTTSEHVLEKLFALFMEQGNLWPDILGLPEVKRPNMSEINLHGYLHEYMISLEKNGKLDVIEAINEKIRKRFKNPKLSNSNCAKVCRHASLAWCRSLINGLAAITPMHPGELSEALNSADGSLDNGQLLCVDLKTCDLWNTEFEDQIQSKALQTKWYPFLSKIKNTVVRRASQESLETANTLLKSSFNFYRESSCEILKSGINLYLIPSRLATEMQFHQSTDGVEHIDLSIPRKLLLWAYTLQHGQYVNISQVVKHCEDSVKSKIKRGSGTLPISSGTLSAATSVTVAGLVRDGASSGVCADLDPAPARVKAPSASQSGGNASHSASLTVSSCETPKNSFSFPQLHHCNNSGGDRSNSMTCEGDQDLC